jgi:hypothetical protein
MLSQPKAAVQSRRLFLRISIFTCQQKSNPLRWDSPFKICRFIIQDVFKLTEATNYSVSELVNSEVRIFLLYSTQVKSIIYFHEIVHIGWDL